MTKEYKRFKIRPRGEGHYQETRFYANTIGSIEDEKEGEYFILSLSPRIQQVLWDYPSGIVMRYWRLLHTLSIVEVISNENQ